MRWRKVCCGRSELALQVEASDSDNESKKRGIHVVYSSITQTDAGRAALRAQPRTLRITSFVHRTRHATQPTRGSCVCVKVLTQGHAADADPWHLFTIVPAIQQHVSLIPLLLSPFHYKQSHNKKNSG